MKRILCFGDSNTYGYDGRLAPLGGDGARYDEETRWTCLLERRLGAGFRLTEAGLGGRTTVFDDPLVSGRSGLDSLDPVFLSCEPVDLVIVMLGTNDQKDHFAASAEVITDGMSRLLRRLKTLIAESKQKDAKILLLSPPPLRKPDCGRWFYDFSEASLPKSAALPGCYRALAERLGCAFCDTAAWAGLDSSDGTHLGPEGHRAFAEALEPVVRALLQ